MPVPGAEAALAGLCLGGGGVSLAALLLMCLRVPPRRLTSTLVLAAAFAGFGGIAVLVAG